MKFRILCLFLLVGQFAFGQQAQLTQQLHATIDSLRETSGIPGMSFSVVLPNNTLITVNSGVADLETKSPLTPETRMLAGSTGKTFFASLAFLAVENKKLSFDDPCQMQKQLPFECS